MDPKELAAEIFAEMSPEQRNTAKWYGAGDMQDRVVARMKMKRPATWGMRDVADCLDEIDRLSGCEGE